MTKAARHAVVTGATGQIGSYTVERLLADGWRVTALLRPGGRSVVAGGVETIDVDLLEAQAVDDALIALSPDAIVHLAGTTSVAESWNDPVTVARSVALATVGIAHAAARLARAGAATRLVHASSAEIFGAPTVTPQSEATRIQPVTPYGAAKAHAHFAVQTARSRGVLASNLVLFNHESPRRPAHFVSRTVSAAVAAIARGDVEHVTLGNLEARRDWGWAPDAADAIVATLALDGADDLVIATGEHHSVLDLALAAFRSIGVDEAEAHRRIQTDDDRLRPHDAAVLCGDASRARDVLAWRPSRDLDGIMASMVAADQERESSSNRSR